MKYLLLLLAVFSLTLRFHFSETKQYREGEVVRVTARLTMSPEEQGRVQKMVLYPAGYEPLYLSAPLYPAYDYGQILSVKGKVKLSDSEKKVFASLSYPEIVVRENDSLLYGLIAFIRSKVMRIYQHALPPDGASLLMGIVFGIKQGMSQEFKDALSSTGVYHVVAASGMNVTLIAGAFMVIFGTYFRRQTALLVSIGGIFFYALLAGFEPSIVRASIMGSLVFLAGILGRQNMALWTLCLTGFLMLFVKPTLIADVGFQLSFLATLGILLIKPALYFAQRGEGRGDEHPVVEDLKTTLAAQLGTMPVLLSAFGQVSILSLFVNLLVLWTVPLLMFIGSISALVGFLSEPLGQLIAQTALPFLLYFQMIVRFFGNYNYMVNVEEVSWWWVVLYYLALFAFVRWRKHTSRSSHGFDARIGKRLRTASSADDTSIETVDQY